VCGRCVIDGLDLNKALVYISAQGLGLRVEAGSPVVINFEAVVAARCKQGLKKPGVLKACKPKPGLKILDATAGFGRDAAVLASSGAEVLMCEREPILVALLTDALARLSADMNSNLNLQLIPQDAKDYLKALDAKDYPDIIYLDPMHPARNKSARVKKDLYALQQLLGADENPLDLLHAARAHAKRSVVLKWPAKQPVLLKPNYVIEGKTVCFCVYSPSRPL
jgi:16S rRNA (guanine1516-N2)-methyltransferase